MKTLPTLAPKHGGLPDNDALNAWTHQFKTIEAARACAAEFGAKITVPDALLDRQCELYADSTGVLMLRFKAKTGDPEPAHAYAKSSWWYLSLHVPADQRPVDDQLTEQDSFIRYVGQLQAFYIKQADGEWATTQAVREYVTRQLNNQKSLVALTMGKAVFHGWKLIHAPFQPEWNIENRTFNPRAPRLRFEPMAGPHPTWDMILSHFFRELDGPLKGTPLVDGLTYGTMWLASRIQYPLDPLPYLFAFGPENSGKSIVHEAFRGLVTSGVQAADRALKSDFCGELVGTVLAYVEESDVSKKGSLERIKAFVTSPQIQIRRMKTDAYSIPNALHWIQTANDKKFCPVFAGDTRIVSLYVPRPEVDIPKGTLLAKCIEEAPAFTHTLLNTILPEPMGRLRLPAIETPSKVGLMTENAGPLPRAVAEFMAARTEWTGNSSELFLALEDETLPSDGRVILKKLQEAGDFLSPLGIKFDVSEKPTKRGRIITLSKT